MTFNDLYHEQRYDFDVMPKLKLYSKYNKMKKLLSENKTTAVLVYCGILEVIDEYDVEKYAPLFEWCFKVDGYTRVPTYGSYIFMLFRSGDFCFPEIRKNSAGTRKYYISKIGVCFEIVPKHAKSRYEDEHE